MAAKHDIIVFWWVLVCFGFLLSFSGVPPISGLRCNGLSFNSRNRAFMRDSSLGNTVAD